MAGPASRARIEWTQFGFDLRETRKRYGSLRSVAKTLGVSAATWSRAERGKPIQPALLIWLADWCGRDARCYLAPLYTKGKRRS